MTLIITEFHEHRRMPSRRRNPLDRRALRAVLQHRQYIAVNQSQGRGSFRRKTKKRNKAKVKKVIVMSTTLLL